MEVKSPTTHKQQLAQLIARGCQVDNEGTCIDVLSRVNYYRFTAYFLPFRNKDRETYKDGTNFSQVYDIYQFDKRLRALILSAIEDIEIYVRTQLSYFHAHKYGALGYKDPQFFMDYDRHQTFLAVGEREIESNKKILFVKHHIEKYEREFPVWVISELFSLGTLSQFFSNMLTGDRKALAVDMFGVHEKVARSWLHCCTSLRNICAHYGRLYFRELGTIPATPKGHSLVLDRTTYSAIYMLKLMFPDKDKWDASFVLPLSALIEKYSTSINLVHIGFPEDWEEQLTK